MEIIYSSWSPDHFKGKKKIADSSWIFNFVYNKIYKQKEVIDLILRKTANYWVPVVVILTLLGMVCFNLNFTQDIRFEDHFAPHWSAAREWMREGWSPYSEETQQATLSLLRDNKSYTE